MSVNSADWQSQKPLTGCLEYILTKEIATDIAFIVGDEREIVRAHKCILLSRSPVFYAMFEGPLSQRGDIEIPDISKTTFKTFLRYLYTDSVSLSLDDVFCVLYTAKKYCVDLLVEECYKFLKDNITFRNVCNILEQTHKNYDDAMFEYCLKIIFENPQKCFESFSFEALCKECLHCLIDSDDIVIKEHIVFESAVRWADSQCTKKGISLTPKNRLQILGEALYLIRFPIVESTFLEGNAFIKEMLPSDQLEYIRQYKIDKIKHDQLKFKTKERGGSKVTRWIRVERFRSQVFGWSYAGKPDSISFRTSTDGYLYGVGIYGSTQDDIGMILSVEDEHGHSHHSSFENIERDNQIAVHDILFDERVKILANTIYTITAHMTGGSSYYGNHGYETVHLGGCTVTFIRRKISTNGTGINVGQYPALLMSFF